MLDFNHDYHSSNICSFCRVRDRTGDEEAVTPCRRRKPIWLAWSSTVFIRVIVYPLGGWFSIWAVLFSAENALVDRENKAADRWTNHGVKRLRGPLIVHNAASDSRFCGENGLKGAVPLPFCRFCFLCSDFVFWRKRFGISRKCPTMPGYAQACPAPRGDGRGQGRGFLQFQRRRGHLAGRLLRGIDFK